MNSKREVRLRAYEKQQVLWAACYVQKNLAAPLDAEMVAIAADLSLHKLKVGFVQAYQTSFTDFVKQQRMKKAEAMLLETNALVAVVAKACGYTNESAFYRAFKKWKGQTPDDFRKR